MGTANVDSTGADDPWAAHYAGAAGFRYWPCEELVRSMSMRSKETRDVLEVGCGNGANLWYLIEHAHCVTGLDASESALRSADEYCRQRMRVDMEADISWRLRFVRSDILSGPLPFMSRTFGGIVDCMVSQHISAAVHETIYREYFRLLKPGGWLFLYHLDSATSCDTTKIECEFGSFEAPPAREVDYPSISLFPKAGFTCLPTPQWLATCVEDAGFSVTSKRRMSRTYATGDIASYSVIEAVKE